MKESRIPLVVGYLSSICLIIYLVHLRLFRVAIFEFFRLAVTILGAWSLLSRSKKDIKRLNICLPEIACRRLSTLISGISLIADLTILVVIERIK